MPAIVVMSVAGLLVGPIFGLINPQESMGDLFGPIITFAVALILFEGSLNLDFKEIRGFNKPVLRIITIGAFIAWIAGSLAAHYVAGLSLSVVIYYRWLIYRYRSDGDFTVVTTGKAKTASCRNFKVGRDSCRPIWCASCRFCF